jgi:hypothetical protein
MTIHAGTESGGRYDAEATEIRERLNARGVLLLVAGGDPLGSGFSIQGSAEFMRAVPDLLEQAAARIREDLKAAGIA